MPRSTVFSFSADTKDFDAKLNGLKVSAEATFIALEQSTLNVRNAQDKLNRSTKIFQTQITSTKTKIATLNAEKEKNKTLSKEQQDELTKLTAHLKKLNDAQTHSLSIQRKRLIEAKRTMASQKASLLSYNTMLGVMGKEDTQRTKNVSSLRKENAERRALGTTLVRHIRRLESLAVAYFAVTRAYQSTLGVGVQLNREYENMELGIAALIAAKTKAVDATGKEVDATTKFMVAQSQTKDVLTDIKKAAAETPATFSQMVGFYQQAIGHALATNGAFGASLQDVNKNTISFTKRISALASSVGMSMDLVNEEVRSLMSGDVTTDSKLALILFGSPTKANEAIKEAKKSVNGLTNLFNEKLFQFELLEDIDTYDKNLAKLIGQLDTLRKEAAKPIFDDVSQSFKDLTIYLEANGQAISDTIKRWYDLGKAGLQYADDVAKVYAAYKIGGAVATGIITIIGLMTKLNKLKQEALVLTKTETALEIVLQAVKTKGLSLAIGAGAGYAAYEGINYMLEKLGENANNAYDSLKQLEDIRLKGDVDVGTYKPFDAFGEPVIDKQQLIDGLKEAESMLKMHQDSLKDAVKQNNEVLIKDTTEAIMFYQKQIRSFSVDLKDYIQLKMLQAEIEKKSKSEIKAEQKAFEDRMKRKLDIERRGELLGLDDESKRKKELYHKYLADLEKFKEINGAKLILTKEYNEAYDKIEKDYADKRIKDQATQSRKDFEAEMQIRKLSIGLISDERERKLALAELNHQDRLDELDHLYTIGKLTKEHYDKRIELENKSHDKLMDGYSVMGTVIRNATDKMEDGLSDFFDKASDGFLDFGNLANDVLDQILQDMLKMSVIQPLTGVMKQSGTSAWTSIGQFATLMFSAKGNVMPSSPSLSAHSNTVVSQPTPFFFAQGGVPNLGIMGEAGSEAILPLTRTSDGDLGVKSIGGGGNVILNIENNTSTPIEAEMISNMLKKDERGEEQRVINIVMKNATQNSSFRNTLKGAIG